MKRFSTGFTVLEILIVVAVFGLFIALGALSLGSARARLRDAQRVSDMSVLRSTLSQYWLEKANYPASTGVNLGQSGTQTDALTSAGFVSQENPSGSVYLNRIPTGPKTGEFYRYKGGSNGYSIRFQTERDTAFGAANVYYAHASGIDNKDEEK